MGVVVTSQSICFKSATVRLHSMKMVTIRQFGILMWSRVSIFRTFRITSWSNWDMLHKRTSRQVARGTSRKSDGEQVGKSDGEQVRSQTENKSASQTGNKSEVGRRTIRQVRRRTSRLDVVERICLLFIMERSKRSNALS